MHGTGVREPSYTTALEAVRAGLARVRPDARVEPCDWGTPLGSYLRAGGVSIPGYAPAGAGPAGPGTAGAGAAAGTGPAGLVPAREDEALDGDETREDDEARLRWAMLYADPFAELDAYALAGPPPGSAAPAFVPGAAAPGDALLDLVGRLDAAPAARAAWAAAVPSVPLTEAVAALLASPALRRAAASAAPEGDALPRLAARALTAWALVHSGRPPGEVPVAARDDLADTLTAELGGDIKGLSDLLVSALGFSARLFERSLGSRMLVARRGAISGRSVGFFGDVLSYLTRGQAVRDHVAATIRALPGEGPVVVLGHSLGGIIAVDLLADPPPGLAVDLLVTVGSQAPLLYELDALPSLPYGTGLPRRFPRWLNIYDRRDLLSYLASGAFGHDPRVTDVEVDNGQPVSAAHSAYWANDMFFREFSTALPG
ncbi:alpha/beta fold hydrolase [Streptomyces sp. NPDC015131]|uniref:alpha/beta fold hydrolase n=1 Tax=Streptomyces sp. NPDC015131 TaxID=3364941 RepID=UPI0036FBD8DB